MAKFKIKLFILYIFGSIILNVTKSAVLEDLIDLKSNITGLLSVKGLSFRLDSYTDVCLYKFEKCENGFSLLLNISFVSLNHDGTNLLISSGGDSSYTSGGFYLHQIKSSTENYLEFGLGTQANLYISKIYLNENSNAALAFIWDTNKKALKVFVDGVIYQTITQYVSRSYWSLNFNPIKFVEMIKPNAEPAIKSTILNTAYFKNISFESIDPIIRGSLDKYQIGCFSSIDSTLLKPVKISVTDEYLSLTEVEQCKITCTAEKQQIFLVVSSSKCYCVLNQNEMAKGFTNTKCSEDASIFKAYIATNLNFVRPTETSLDLDIKLVLKNDPIEIDDTVGFRITSKNSAKKFKTSIDFGENVIKSSVGNSFLFHQYSKPGSYMIKVMTSSSSMDNLVLNRVFNITVQNKQDKLPMYSVKLGPNSQTYSENKWNVNFHAEIGGGAPFSCVVNFGDETNTKYDFDLQLNSFHIKHTYDYTGIYNSTIKCVSKTIENSFVTDWKIVYLPKQKSETNTLTPGNAAYFDHHIILKLTNPESETKLELPFQLASPNLMFQVDDLTNNQMAIVQWISPENSLNPAAGSKENMAIKIKNKFLVNFQENYFHIKSCDIVLASYLITIEEAVVEPPQIKVLTHPLRQNEPVNFEITISPLKSSSLIYIYFNGNKESTYFYQYTAIDTSKPVVIATSFVFPESQLDNSISVTIGNHLSQQSSVQQVQFESSLNNFLLSVASNLNDPSQEAVFKLQPIGNLSLGYVKLENIQVYFDGNDLTKSKTFGKYTFDKSNDFSLTFTYKYTQFGTFNIWANCSNLISNVVTKASLKIGTKLGAVNGAIQNKYATIDEFIYIPVKVTGGNGYDISVEFNDGNLMVLPWSFLTTNGQSQEPSRQIEYSKELNIVSPKAMFNKTVLVVMYKYSKPGEYSIKVHVKNQYSSLELSFCSKVYIQEAHVDKSNEPEQECVINYKNLQLMIENNLNEEPIVLTENTPFKLAKGLQNTFSIELKSECNRTDILQTYWQIFTRIPQNGMISENLIEKYCFISGSNNTFTLKPYELDAGDYSIKAYAFRQVEPQNYVFLSNYILSIGSTPLIAKLNNGEKNVELNENETLTLDFYYKSYDPDLIGDSAKERNADKKNFEFYFVCTEGGNTNPNRSMLIKSAKAKAEKYNYDFESLGYSLKFHNKANNIWFYEENCFTQEPEAIRPQIVLDEETRKITINSNDLKLNETGMTPMMLQLFVRKFMRVSSLELKIQINMSSFFFIPDASDFDKMSEALNRLDDFAKTNPKGALKLLDGFVSAINSKSDEDDMNMNQTTTTTLSTPQDNSNKTEQYAKLRGQMLGTVGTILNGVDDADSLISAAGATAGVSANTKQMNSNNQESGSQVVAMLGSKAENIEPEMVGALASSMLNCGGNMLVAGAETAQVDNDDRLNSTFLEPENDTAPEPEPLPAKITVPLKFYEQDGGDFPEDLNDLEVLQQEEVEFVAEGVRNKTADIAKKTFGGIGNAGKALVKGANVSNSTEGNFTQVIEGNGMALIVSKAAVNKTSNESATFSSSSGSSIQMPSLNAVIGPNENGSVPSAVSTNMIVSNSNPYQSKKGSSSGTIVSLKLSDENGTELVVNNTAEPFVINIPAVTPAALFQSSVGLLEIIYHKLYLPTNTSSLHIEIYPVTKGDIYHVYIKYSVAKVIDVQPSEKSYDYAYTLPNFNNTESENKMHTIFITQNETKGNGTYYVGVKLAVLSNITKNELREKNLTANNSIKSYYSVRLYTTSCKYWKEDAKEWSTDGCEVGDGTTFELTQCKCRHLTTFGTDFYVPPNTIDFSTVFSKFDIAGNPSVFATIVSILGLYILIAIFLRWKDKKDLIKWGATPLCDNLPTDMFHYLISVQTGFGRDTSTTSKIGFVLSGEFADSGVRKLSDDKRKSFKSGSVCNFIMSTEEALGPLTYLRIWHDNSGSGNSKSWYLNTVDIVDLQTNDKSNFVCNSWLAVEKGDGQIDRVLPVACKNDLISFKHLFGQSVKKKFSDNHLWFSVFSRPTKSSFTRLQRMTCCMSLLFCTMIANAMFYKAEDGKAKSGVITIVGPIKFSMGQLFTSIVGTLIVVPVNLIIVTLFRKAKLKHHGILPTKQNHVAKQQYWRKVKIIENIELPNNDHSKIVENFNVKYDISKYESTNRNDKEEKSL